MLNPGEAFFHTSEVWESPLSRVLIAGGAGFLGSNLAKSFLNSGHDVIVLDNFATSNTATINELSKNTYFEFHNASVTQDSDWPDFGKLDYIFHMASPASPPSYLKLGLETIKANTTGTENLINLAINNDARFIYASTSEIYGDPSISPQPEDYWGNVNPIGPRSVYDESKRLGETITALYTREHGLNSGIVRIFNTYGPGLLPSDGRVVSNFIKQALDGVPYTIYGDGSQTRSFCFVDDLIRGLVLMSASNSRGPINLGNPREINLLTLCEMVSSAVGIKSTFNYFALPEDDPKIRKPDITRAQEVLGWNPETNLEDGLRETIQWMKRIRAGK
jgi:dTDP-glucose 4,6-dehydratase